MTPASPALQHARILIVDDQPANVAVLEAMLTQGGYTSLMGVTDPREVASLCKAAQPDLILLDLHMPHLNGFAVMEQLQAIVPADCYLPILVLTADITAQTRRHALEVGAHDFLSKPLDRVEVLLRVRNLLQTRARHRAQEERYRALAAYGSDLTVILDADGTLRYVSPSFARVLGHLPISLTGTPFALLIHPDDQDAVHGALAHGKERDGLASLPDHRLRHADGTWRSVEAGAVSRLADPAIEGIIVTARDVTAQKTLSLALREQGQVDPVTRLPNRTRLHEAVAAALRADGAQVPPCALLVVRLGAGSEDVPVLGFEDRLLQEVALRLSSLKRPGDTLARLGDAHFALLLPGTRVAAALWAARRVLAALAAPVALPDGPMQIRGTIGVGLSPDHGSEPEALFRAAAGALEVAGHSPEGYSLYTTAQAQQAQQAAHRRTLLATLQHAIARNQLVLHYQPKVDLSAGTTRVSGVEALVRWVHPELGLIPPDQFIGLAEQHGLIDAMTHWVIEAALRQCQTWHQVGLPLDVAVNVSLRSLADPRLPSLVAGLVQQYRVAAQCLILEITESALMLEQERTLAVLGQIAALGVRLSIDDFGTGYSSLGYLRRMPLAEVKIDRSFVRTMSSAEQDRAIVESVVTLGHKLGLTVVAEGVENHRTLNLLSELGCDRAQGYYFTAPLPAAEFKHWLDRSIWGIQQVVGNSERRRPINGAR